MYRLLLMTVIGSCAGIPIHAPKVEVEPTLQMYVDSFEKDGRIHLRDDYEIWDIKLRFSKNAKEEKSINKLFEPIGVLGVCHKKYGSTPEIVIMFSRWEEFNYNTRKYLIYHELGHCVLNLKHNLDTTYSESIMAPSLYPGAIISNELMDLLIKQLFLRHSITALTDITINKNTTIQQ